MEEFLQRRETFQLQIQLQVEGFTYQQVDQLTHMRDAYQNRIGVFDMSEQDIGRMKFYRWMYQQGRLES